MSLLVLYHIEDNRWDGQGNTSEGLGDGAFNAVEVPILDHAEKEVLLGDLLQYFSTSSLRHLVGTSFAFYAEVDGVYKLLPSVASVLPVKTNNTVVLKLVHSSAPPVGGSCEALQCELAFSRQALYELDRGDRRAKPRYQYDGDRRAAGAYSGRGREGGGGGFGNAPEPKQAGTAPGAPDLGLHAIVGEETAAALSEAAEVAKGAAAAAAKSFMSFASIMGKTVLDAAANVAAASGGGIGGGSSGGPLAAGSSVTCGLTKVVVQRQLSEGGFGIVFLANDAGNGRPYALKQLICQSKEQVQEAHGEIDILKLLRGHPNIVELVDHCSISMPGSSNTWGPRQVMLLFPLFPKGTAWDAIERSAGSLWPFPEYKALHIVLQMAQALQYMHDKGFTHRDVKPHNILLSDPETAAEEKRGFGRAVLMDFGSVAPSKVNLASRQDALRLEDEASVKSSMPYRAPELVTPPFPPYVVDERVDVWSLGCTMYCLAYGYSPFETPREGVQKLAILNGRFAFPANHANRECEFSENYETIVQSMLEVDQKKRPFMRDVAERCRALLAASSDH